MKKRERIATTLATAALGLAGLAACSSSVDLGVRKTAQPRTCNTQGQDCKIEVYVADTTQGGCVGHVEDDSEEVVVKYRDTPVIWRIRDSDSARYEFFGDEITFTKVPNNGYLLLDPTNMDKKRSVWKTTATQTPAPLKYVPVIRRVGDQVPCVFPDPVISNMGS